MPKSNVQKVQVVTIKKPKMRPRGKPFTAADARFDNTPEGKARASAAQAKRKTFSGGSAKISIAYSMMLTEEVPDEVRTKLGVSPDQKCTWADLIALQTVKRAVGVIPSEAIGFTAITELRETTEGKTADKLEQSGPNGIPLTAPPIQVNFVDPPKRKDPSPNAPAHEEENNEEE